MQISRPTSRKTLFFVIIFLQVLVTLSCFTVFLVAKVALPRLEANVANLSPGSTVIDPMLHAKTVQLVDVLKHFLAYFRHQGDLFLDISVLCLIIMGFVIAYHVKTGKPPVSPPDGGQPSA